MKPAALALLAALLATAAAPVLKPASAKALHGLLNGRTLEEVHERVAGTGPEIFCADGRWTQQIERVRRHGRWRVETGRLCIDDGSRFPFCRHAFLDRRGGLWLAPEGAAGAARAYRVGPNADSAFCAADGSP